MRRASFADLRPALTAQPWIQVQVYGVLPGYAVRLHMAGRVCAVEIADFGRQVCVRCSEAFAATSREDWQEAAHDWSIATGCLRMQPIGAHRLALIVPGKGETTVTVLFGANDDGTAILTSSGFSLEPVDLARIAEGLRPPEWEPQQQQRRRRFG